MTGTDPRGRPHQADLDADGPAPPAAAGPVPAGLNNSLRAVRAAFYGRTACAAGSSGSQTHRNRQFALCRMVTAACGIWVTAEFFDEDCRAGCPCQDRPQGRSWLAVLPRPGHPARAIVVADPCRLLPRRPAAGSTSALVRLAFQQVRLVLGDSGMVVFTAEEYALPSELLLRPAAGQTAGSSQPGPPVAGRHFRLGGRG